MVNKDDLTNPLKEVPTLEELIAGIQKKISMRK